MAGNDEFTNLSLVKVGRFDKEVKLVSEGAAKAGTKKDEDAAAFKRLMAKMQEEARPPWMHGRGALDHDDLLYLKEQSAAEKDAERLRDLMEKQAFKTFQAAASSADMLPGGALRVEPKTRSGIRQQSLLKNIVEVRPRHVDAKPKRLRAEGAEGDGELKKSDAREDSPLERIGSGVVSPRDTFVQRQSSGSLLLGLAYESSESEDTGEEEAGKEGEAVHSRRTPQQEQNDGEEATNEQPASSNQKRSREL